MGKACLLSWNAHHKTSTAVARPSSLIPLFIGQLTFLGNCSLKVDIPEPVKVFQTRTLHKLLWNRVYIELLDTVLQENLSSFPRLYYEGMNVLIVCYWVDDMSSFPHARKYGFHISETICFIKSKFQPLMVLGMILCYQILFLQCLLLKVNMKVSI